MKLSKGAKPSGRTAAGERPDADLSRAGAGERRASGEEDAAAISRPASWRLTIPAAALIVLAAVAAYHNSFFGPFVWDDLGAIVGNRTIRRLWPVWPALSPPPNGETVSGRPVLNLSLAINYAVSGQNVWSYHVTNLLIHIAAAVLLMGILRRTFLSPPLRDRFGRAAAPLALAAALIWTVHPLQTESVTYVVQRAESLMGLFYLLTLYCVIRGATPGTVLDEGRGARDERRGTNPANHRSQAGDYPPSPARSLWCIAGRPVRSTKYGAPSSVRSLWYVAAVLACLLGMACKEVMVTAPLIVLLYDRTFLAGSFAQSWRQRWGLYLGLAATWALLAYLVCSTGLIRRQAEMGAPDVWGYARSQPGVIVHYLRLSVFPNPLCVGYDWPLASTMAQIVPGAIAMGLLLAGTVWGLMGRRGWGFLGAWFFLILAPTSSILPLNQLVHEHRMYLSLAAEVVLAVAGTYLLWDRICPRRFQASLASTVAHWFVPLGAAAAVLVALGYSTILRNADYRTSLSIWQDAVNKRPSSVLAHNNLANALIVKRRFREAIEHCNEALRRKPDYPAAHYNLGLALGAVGETDAAINHYRQAIRLRSDYAEAHNNLAIALAAAGRSEEAIRHFQEALRLDPDLAQAYNNLANLLARAGKTQEAIDLYRQSLRLKPDDATTRSNLAAALAGSGQWSEAIEHCQQALRLKPDDVTAHDNLGIALAATGRLDEAIDHYREALRLKPEDAGSHENLAIALAGVGRSGEAIQHYRKALRLRPDYAEAHNNLGDLLVRLGRSEEAIQSYREALRLKPSYAKAHHNLADLLAALGRIDEAIQHYDQALQWQPDYPEVHNNLGIALAAAGRTGQAIEHYQRALRLKPNFADAHNNLGALLAGLGRTGEALAHYREALRLKPDHADAQYNLGLALAAMGKTHEAIEHYRRLLQRTPNSLKTLYQLAWLLATDDPAQGGDPTEAVQVAERARQFSGAESIQCLDTLAAAYAAAGRFADAVTAAERAVQLAESAGQATLARLIRARLELYRTGQPYREGQDRRP
jgi:tetratricopeptide (TPR) repeat protein